MERLSVIIPSYRDQYLNRTVESVLRASKEDVEIIAFLDAFEPGSDLIEDPRVRYIKSEDNVGMRGAINRLSKEATGKYLMKLDSHCNISDGFDSEMKSQSCYNMIQVPVRYNINTENWKRKNRGVTFVGLRYPDNFKKEIGFRSVLMRKKIKGLEDIIIFQGACWFMEKDFFFKIGCLDEGMFGTWGVEAQELSMKTWLCNNGRVVRNPKVWYAHYRRDKILMKSMKINLLKNMKKSFRMCLCDEWPGQNKSFKWLVDKIGPFPKWPSNWHTEEYVNELKSKGYI